ncbi:unnamed protein product [Dibothriocephalus latus]|uniref:Programmed cell death protein 5 n=1 Tax=Dibothriocephalus latus TaxID=60516 RepID=A0A3P6T7T4_DIBLA|nr:unnamed protein product [Dibothriocephalus latus]
MMPVMNDCGDANAQAQQEAQKAEIEKRQKEMTNDILSRILDQNARARLNTLAMTKPDKAKAVENMLVNMARSGRIGGKVTEEQLKDLLTQIASASKPSTTVKAFGLEASIRHFVFESTRCDKEFIV